MEELVGAGVENLDGAVLLGGEVQAVAFDIHGEVVKITFLESGQGDGLYELQGGIRLSVAANCQRDKYHQNHKL